MAPLIINQAKAAPHVGQIRDSITIVAITKAVNKLIIGGIITTTAITISGVKMRKMRTMTGIGCISAITNTTFMTIGAISKSAGRRAETTLSIDMYVKSNGMVRMVITSAARNKIQECPTVTVATPRRAPTKCGSYTTDVREVEQRSEWETITVGSLADATCS